MEITGCCWVVVNPETGRLVFVEEPEDAYPRPLMSINPAGVPAMIDSARRVSFGSGARFVLLKCRVEEEIHLETPAHAEEHH